MSEADAVPEHATTADNDARVAQAAVDLGVEVPDRSLLTGIDDAGRHTALMPGNASALKISTAILRRLDGHSVADSVAPPKEEPGPQPEWMPPEDPNDTEAWDAWMAERARHPKWPVFYKAQLTGSPWWLPVRGSPLRPTHRRSPHRTDPGRRTPSPRPATAPSTG